MRTRALACAAILTAYCGGTAFAAPPTPQNTPSKAKPGDPYAKFFPDNTHIPFFTPDAIPWSTERIWSTCTPSSRVWMRSVCVPVDENRTVVVCASHHAPSGQPQLAMPHALHGSRFTRSPDAVPVR